MANIKRTAKTTAADTKQKAAPAAPAAEATAKVAAGPTRNKGVTSGMRIMEYQDHSLIHNSKKLTDQQLADDWAREFPLSDVLQRKNPSLVALVRRLVNENKHGSQKEKAPAGGVKMYDAAGKVVEEAPRARRGVAAPATQKMAKAS